MNNDFDAATLQEAHDRLAQFTGPIARVLVRDAAHRSRTTTELFLHLATHLQNDADRATLLNGFVDDDPDAQVEAMAKRQAAYQAEADRQRLLGETVLQHAAADAQWGEAFWSLLDQIVDDSEKREKLGLPALSAEIV